MTNVEGTVKNINPDNVLAKIDFRNQDGKQSSKVKRLLIRELKGLSPQEKIAELKRLFPDDKVWIKYNIQP